MLHHPPVIPPNRSLLSLVNDILHQPIIEDIAVAIFSSIGFILAAPFVLPCITVRFIADLARSFSNQVTSVDAKRHAVVVTGADTGFGREASLQLARDGFLVFAGCLSEHSIPELQTEAEGGAGELIGIKFDVTSDQDVSSCQAVIASQLEQRGYRGLYALINNAGICRVSLSLVVFI